MTSYDFLPELSEGAVKPPVFLTSTFAFKGAGELAALIQTAHDNRGGKSNEALPLIYSRINHPNAEIFEKRFSLWNGSEEAAVFASGMAAIATTSFAFLRPGDILLHSSPLYGGTEDFFARELRTFGIKTASFSAESDYSEIKKIAKRACRRGPLRMIFVEAAANPTNVLADIEACAEIAEEFSSGKRKAITVVDNTFLGPLWLNPFKHGADLALYSATKYIGGHSDLLAGVVEGKAKMISRLKSARTRFGNIAGAFTCWLLTRSLETLKLRMTAQVKNARRVADFLRDDRRVEKVYYPEFFEEDSNQNRLYEKQCSAPGAVVSFDIKGGRKTAFRFLDALKFFKLAVSLGSTEPLAEHPATTTHYGIPREKRIRLGITDKMIRLSIGLGSPYDYIFDLKQALDEAVRDRRARQLR
ncbi:MAG: aminotransferase class I/II-fold pyridoxal phosphate-dependent enzyme [Candidatus Niyogibacteria bacterium]|nr:MAG: aminotransferase class I/II-fold pyridoxal phosphate-dependent enzyme [Candidatus Niyogibacteria bacterium]